jgi:hypothetical protein
VALGFHISKFGSTTLAFSCQRLLEDLATKRSSATPTRAPTKLKPADNRENIFYRDNGKLKKIQNNSTALRLNSHPLSA